MIQLQSFEDEEQEAEAIVGEIEFNRMGNVFRGKTRHSLSYEHPSSAAGDGATQGAGAI